MPLVSVLLKHALPFYATTVLLVAVLMSLGTGVRDQYQLANEGVRTQGVVVEPLCESHLAFKYQFVVGNTSYEGFSVSESCSDLRLGASVPVYFRPDDPKVNTAEDPADLFGNSLSMIILASLTSPAFLLLIFRLQLRATERQERHG